MDQHIPPPPGFGPPGHFQEPYPQFDVGGYDSDDNAFNGGFDAGPQRNNSTKKNNNNKGDKNKKNAAVEVRYEGFYLEKAPSDQVGEKPSWSRVGRQAMPFGDAKLAEIVKKVHRETGCGPMTNLSRLSSDQRSVINRLVTKRQLDEKAKDAEWVLAAVRPEKERQWSTRTIIIKNIMVIIKRQDRNMTKSGSRVTTKGLNQYQKEEIIDLTDPLPGKKDKKGNKTKNHNDNILDVPHGVAMPDPFAGLGGHGPPQGVMEMPPPPGHHQPQPHFQGPPQHPPPGGIPIDQFPPHHNGPMPHEGNPFQPNPPFNMPGAFDMPPTIDPLFQTRSRTPIRRLSNSRSRSREQRRFSQERERKQRRDSARLERKVDILQDDLRDRFDDIANKVEEWNLRDNSPSSSGRDSFFDREDFWSAPPSGGSFTPPSTPPLSAGTLGKGYRRDLNRPPYHRRAATQAIMEPYDSRSNRRIDYETAHRRRRGDVPRSPLFSPPGGSLARDRRPKNVSRPMLHHVNTWNGNGNDYPSAPIAERERPPMRRISQYPVGEEYDYANFNNGRGRRERRREYEYEDGGRYYGDERRGGARRERAAYY